MLWKVMTSVINGFERRIIKSPFETPSMQNRWLKVVAAPPNHLLVEPMVVPR